MHAPQGLNTIYYDNIKQASMMSKSKKTKESKVKTSIPPSSQSTKDYAAAFASLQQQFGASGHTPCPAFTPKSKA